MASYFVSSASGAGGAGNGSSWANAYLTIALAIARPLAAGDTLLVGDDHNESNSSTANWNFGTSTLAGPINVIVVDHTKSSPTAADLKIGTNGAGSVLFTAAANLAIISGNLYFYGLYIAVGSGSSSSNMSINTCPSARSVYFEQCTFAFLGTGTGYIFQQATSSSGFYRKCTFVLSSACQLLPRGIIKLSECIFSFPSSSPATLMGTNAGNSVIGIFEGCDLSNFGGTLLLDTNTGPSRYFFKDCKLPFFSGVPFNYTGQLVRGSQAWIINSDTGSTNYRSEFYDAPGYLTTSTTVVRTGGASQGTPYSWRVFTYSSSSTGPAWSMPLDLDPISIWNTTTAATVNVTVEGLADPRDFSALPNNDDFWIDVEALQTSGSPIGITITGTKANPLASNAALTASTMLWDSKATARANSTSYFVGNFFKVASNPGRVFMCTTAGTSASSEPGGFATAVDGGAVTDGTAVFTAMWRFKQTITTGTIQFAGLITVYPRVAKQGLHGLFIDPVATLS